MSSIEKNIKELNSIQDLQQRTHWMNDLHPLGKLLVCVIYIFLVTSFDKYDITPLILMAVYLIFAFLIGELSALKALYRMRIILPIVLFVGIFNPFFDREIVLTIGSINVSGGFLSMITLIIKGFYTVLAAYILIATTSIDDICYALRCIKIPRIIVIVIMLIYRYFDVMAQEADRITTAYKLRAPSQKGIHYKAWGTLVGQWLLRSIDKAELVYESMLLRGFKGDFSFKHKAVRPLDIIYPLVWICIWVIIKLRIFV